MVDSYENYPDQTNYSWWWKSEYELWDMAAIFPWLEYQPYLKMRNQTTDYWHVEADAHPPNRSLIASFNVRQFGETTAGEIAPIFLKKHIDISTNHTQNTLRKHKLYEYK